MNQNSNSTPIKPSNPKKAPVLVWMDMEMTGLEPETDQVLEIAIILTDLQLNVITEGPNLILRQEPETFSKMDNWNQEHHTKSGLWDKALQSNVSRQSAEETVLSFLKQHLAKGQGLLAGNSIWQDRRFLIKYLPSVHTFLHYRMVDVTSIKALVQGWYPAVSFQKKEIHRALEDIRESIDELKYYRENYFKALS